MAKSQKQLAAIAWVSGQSAEFRHSVIVSSFVTAPFELCRSFWVVRQACLFVSFGTVTGIKQKTLSINKKLEKKKQADITKELGLSSLTISTVVGKTKAVEANTIIFYSKTKEGRGANHVDLATEILS